MNEVRTAGSKGRKATNTENSSGKKHRKYSSDQPAGEVDNISFPSCTMNRGLLTSTFFTMLPLKGPAV
jgi:hypothetical protein